ncbi:phosphoribosylformylglycinamidine synthase subunit PurS, partial [Chloroflexota bacterium]
MHRIEISLKSQFPDSRGQGLVKDIADLAIHTVSDVRVTDIYWLDAELSREDLESICRNLLADPVTQNHTCDTPAVSENNNGRDVHVIEVAY